MTTLVLIALILMLICTAAGLIFLVVTMSDQNDDDIIIKNRRIKVDPENDEYELKTPQSEQKPESQKNSLSKKSNIIPFSKSTRIVSHELKHDFERALASMNPTANNVIPEQTVSDNEPEFIDVLDIVNSNSLTSVSDDLNNDYNPDLDEFLFGEQILKGDDTYS